MCERGGRAVRMARLSEPRFGLQATGPQNCLGPVQLSAKLSLDARTEALTLFSFSFEGLNHSSFLIQQVKTK